MSGAKLSDPAPSGMLDDVDVTILKARTANDVAYPNSNKSADCALILDLETDDGVVHQQILSAGRVKAMPDGFGFEQVPKDNSKAKIFIMSLVNLKYPGIDNDIRVFEGAKVHVNTQKYESNIQRDPGEREPTAFVATKIVSLPGQILAGRSRPTKAAATSAAKSQPVPSTASAVPGVVSNGEIDSEAVGAVLEVLASSTDHTSTVPRLSTAVFMNRHNAKSPNAQAIRKLITAEWLTANMEVGNWVIDNQTVTLVQ